ncbi:hypothetical protein E2320_000509, partial [Naja naja]
AFRSALLSPPPACVLSARARRLHAFVAWFRPGLAKILLQTRTGSFFLNLRIKPWEGSASTRLRSGQARWR